MNIQIEDIEHYPPIMLSIILQYLVSDFEFVAKILRCGYYIESALLSSTLRNTIVTVKIKAIEQYFTA